MQKFTPLYYISDLLKDYNPLSEGLYVHQTPKEVISTGGSLIKYFMSTFRLIDNKPILQHSKCSWI